MWFFKRNKEEKKHDCHESTHDNKNEIQDLKENNTTEQNMSKIFDIIITEIGDDGRPIQRPENGVHASSRQELIKLYAECDQKIKIVREYSDDPVVSVDPSNVTSKKTAIPTALPRVPQDIQSNVSAINPVLIVDSPSPNIPKQVDVQPQSTVPKYFSIAGIECKLENGKIYQKQWVKLIGTEAAQYRLISDTNNREIAMNGKHLEVLKWISIEGDQISDSSGLRGIING